VKKTISIALRISASWLKKSPLERAVCAVVTSTLFSVIFFGVLGSFLNELLEDRQARFTLFTCMGFVLSLGVIFLITQLAKEHERVRTLIIRDPDTGLYLRAFLSEGIMQTVSIAQRLEEKFCVFSIDLDDFKSINDTYGHDVGDLAIAHAANILRSVVYRRVHDLIFRCYATGDEFVVLCATKNPEAMLERLKNKFDYIETPMEDHPEIRLSGSIGMASCDAPSGNDWKANPEAFFLPLYQEAERRMYAEKEEKKRQANKG
jgi:diguanylate cyclase